MLSHIKRSALAAAVLIPTLARAQSTPTAPVILNLPASTRALGLGNTGVALRDDDVIFYNPAMLVNASGFSASGEYLSAHAGAGALSAVTRYDNGGIGIGVEFANYQLPTTLLPPGGVIASIPGVTPGASLAATIGFGQTYKGYRLGVAAKYAEEIDGLNRTSRPLADLGVAKDFFRTTFALAVQNLGSDDMILGTQPINLPVRTTLGASKSDSYGPFDVNFTAAVAMLRTDFVQPSGGVEANYSWLSGWNVALRAGARRSAVGEKPLTTGASFTNDRLTFDYALETLVNNRIGHRFGIRVR